MAEDRSKSSADVVAKCNSKCEQMQQQNRLCHCWTLTTTHCDFYHMPLDLFLAQIADLGDKVTIGFFQAVDRLTDGVFGSPTCHQVGEHCSS